MKEQVDVSRSPWRLGPRAARWFDFLLASALVLPTFPLTLLVGQSPYPALLSLAQTVPLFWRRRHPVAVFAVVAGASVLQAATYDMPAWGQVGFPAALYALARYGSGRSALVGLFVGLCGAVVASWVWTTAQFAAYPPGQEYIDYDMGLEDLLPYLLSITAIVLAAWALGSQARIRRAYEAGLVERGRQLAVEAEQRAVLAAAEERTRIAREMHDVVAHGLSVMIVQADGARYAAAKDPDVAVRTLETVAKVGREGLTEMRRLLGLLRGTGDPALAPQPGLADLPSLVTADDRVDLELPDPLPEVPDGVALTVFRLVQESLTNVRKHAGPNARARVRLRTVPGALEVEVVDDGHGASAAGSGGLGLLGMRERVEVHDGTLDVGPAPGGGWAVRARIPT
ncbi:sensor histidine kinase [Aeromicrobium duanguangcaii]|uniref:sensor histidine kinase n=1 Tax=Aeromicrobium duanguangcaii TaxID=2968086 RepID=UPI0020172157|nr:sensor histidine kinase [Aeromicrobium duanguangcaii]MCL3838423.1 sensor histidine kinase [Aeromicrobium duanguangcaii]